MTFFIPFSGAFDPTPKEYGMTEIECKNQNRIFYL